MDNLYRFGEIEVFCEGYDYAEDPYITKGSCGLEYTLEYTKEGNIEYSFHSIKIIELFIIPKISNYFIINLFIQI